MAPSVMFCAVVHQARMPLQVPLSINEWKRTAAAVFSSLAHRAQCSWLKAASAGMLTAGPTSGGQWGPPLKGTWRSADGPEVVGYEPGSSDCNVDSQDPRFFLALIGSIAALITSQPQHFGWWSPPPHVVL